MPWDTRCAGRVQRTSLLSMLRCRRMWGTSAVEGTRSPTTGAPSPRSQTRALWPRPHVAPPQLSGALRLSQRPKRRLFTFTVTFTPRPATRQRRPVASRPVHIHALTRRQAPIHIHAPTRALLLRRPVHIHARRLRHPRTPARQTWRPRAAPHRRRLRVPVRRTRGRIPTERCPEFPKDPRALFRAPRAPPRIKERRRLRPMAPPHEVEVGLSRLHHAMGQTCHAMGQTHHAMGQTCHAMGQTCHAMGQTCRRRRRRLRHQPSRQYWTCGRGAIGGA